MEIGHIEGCTRTLGKSQGYRGLPLRDGKVDSKITGPDTPVMTTAWLPSQDELAALNAGASIHVHIVGTQHPPIMVSIGPVPA